MAEWKAKYENLKQRALKAYQEQKEEIERLKAGVNYKQRYKLINNIEPTNMKLKKATIDLVCELEKIKGDECYNPNSFDGWTLEDDRSTIGAEDI